MRYLLLLCFLFCGFDFAYAEQQICLPESEMDKALADVSGAGSVYCKDKPLEQCMCKPIGKGWHELKKVAEMKDGDEIFSKSEAENCMDQADCEDKLSTKTCLDPEESVLVSADYREIYCSKFVGYNQVPTGRQTLIDDPVKKAAFLQARLDEKNSKQTKIDVLKVERGTPRTLPQINKALDYLLENLK